MKVAIVGSGISGLVAAYRLHPTHEITVFEANDYVGGHTHTHEIALGEERHAIDTGFIVFNNWTYPKFIALLDELGVPSQPTTMSFSVRDDRSGLEYSGESLNSLFAQRRNLVSPRFYVLLGDILKFNRLARRFVGSGDDRTTVGEFLKQHRFSREFSEQYLLPMGAAIWSCPLGTFSKFPIQFIVEFYQNHGLINLVNRPTWRVVRGGSKRYVDAMTRSFQSRIRLRTPIVRMRREQDRVVLRTRSGDVEAFDHVIFACHSDQALRILGDDATATESELLAAFPYSKNIAVLHTDATQLPKARPAWASWNYRVRGDAAAEIETPPSVTYNMNLLQGLKSKHTFCVTLNDVEGIDPKCILKTIEYHHPIFTTKRAAAQARHGELLNTHRTSFCGAYWRNGFHEDGVVSAEAVVQALSRSQLREMLAKNALAGAIS
jgi:predicted NAD/FAD-binding protein